MRYRIAHRTEYAYGKTASLCHNEARLLPRDLPHQRCLGSEVAIEPVPAAYREREDFFGNRVSYFAIQQPHDRLTVTVTSEVRVEANPAQLDFSSDLPWERVRERLRAGTDPAALEARTYVLDSPLVTAGAELADYAAPSFPPGRPLLAAVHDLMQRIHGEFTYDPDFTTVATPLAKVLAHRRGVCQDFAQLAIGCLRTMGLAARYDSGYIETDPPPGGARLTGADASHAWFSVYMPDGDWRGFDPTNNQVPMERHILTAWGRDFSDVTPLKGVIFGGGKHRLKVAVDVQRI